MEYSAPARSGDMASDMGTKQIRIRNQLRSCNEHVVPDGFGQRVANLAVYPRSLQCTPGSSAIESWTSGEERVSFYPRGCEHIKGVLLDLPDVVERAKLFLAKENVPDQSDITERRHPGWNSEEQRGRYNHCEKFPFNFYRRWDGKSFGKLSSSSCCTWQIYYC